MASDGSKLAREAEKRLGLTVEIDISNGSPRWTARNTHGDTATWAPNVRVLPMRRRLELLAGLTPAARSDRGKQLKAHRAASRAEQRAERAERHARVQQAVTRIQDRERVRREAMRQERNHRFYADLMRH